MDGAIGRRNVVWGWTTMILGALSGSILMAWSFNGPFPPPPGFEDYTHVSRRLVRLAHVALFMLPLINVSFGKDIDDTALSETWKQRASWLAIVGMIGIPLGLMLGGIIALPLKYISVIPVYSLLAALGLMAWGKVKLKGERPG